MKKLKDKLLKKQISLNSDQMLPEPSTPVTNYKNRRMIFNQKRLTIAAQQRGQIVQNNYVLNNDEIHSDQQIQEEKYDILSNSSIKSAREQMRQNQNKTTSASFLESASKSIQAGLNKMRGQNQQNLPQNNTNNNQYDDIGYLTNVSFMKNEQKDLDKEEKKLFKRFQKHFQRWSYIAFFISAYILLNVFIGFSSAPFYYQVDSCSRYDPNEQCQNLQIKASQLYISEMISGAYILYQGIIGVILHDKIKNTQIVKLFQNSAKLALVFYLLGFMIRSILYLNMHTALKGVDEKHIDKGIGSFFAEFIEDSTGSIIIASSILLLIFIFYLSNFWIIKKTKRLLDLINNQNDQLLISQSILVNNDYNEAFVTQSSFI